MALAVWRIHQKATEPKRETTCTSVSSGKVKRTLTKLAIVELTAQCRDCGAYECVSNFDCRLSAMIDRIECVAVVLTNAVISTNGY